MTDEQLAKIKAIHGLVKAEEGMRLNELASQVTEGVIVEIGSFKGMSTCYLAVDAKVPVYAIDVWDSGIVYGPIRTEVYNKPETFAAFRENIKALGLSVNYIKGRSSEIAKVWTLPIGMLFIDGCHAYRGVKADVVNYARYVIPGGFIAFHDYRGEGPRTPGVKQVVDELKRLPDWIDWQQTRTVMTARRAK